MRIKNKKRMNNNKNKSKINNKQQELKNYF